MMLPLGYHRSVCTSTKSTAGTCYASDTPNRLLLNQIHAPARLIFALAAPLPCGLSSPIVIRTIAASWVQYNVVSTVRTQHVGFSCLTRIAFDSKVAFIWAEKYLRPGVKLVPSPTGLAFTDGAYPGLTPGAKTNFAPAGLGFSDYEPGLETGITNAGRAALQRRVEVARFCSGALAPGLARLKPLFSREAA